MTIKPATGVKAEFEIQSGIPLPPRKGGREGQSKYPFDQLKVGESFYANIPLGRLSSAAHSKAKKANTKYSVRSEGAGARVWRVK